MKYFVWIILMFYSFVDVQLNVFLFSQILQGHVQQAVSPPSL